MYSVNSATAKWDFLNSFKTDSTTSSQSAFGASLKSMMANQGGIQEMLDKLAEKFANADVSQGKPEAGASGTNEYFGNEEGDKVAVDQSLLAAMFGNSGLAQKVEDAINNFFNSDAGSNAAAGTYTQRSISITITTVRYNVSQFDSESGELMSAQEMMTAMQEKMNELINSLFGRKTDTDVVDATDAESGEDETAPVDETKKSGSGSSPYGAYSYQSFSFSMEMFYSNQLINSMGGDQSGNSMMSQFSFAASGSFQSYAGSQLPSAIYEALTNSSDFSGPFTSLIDSDLSKFGMKSSGFQLTQSGFTLKTGSSGDLLSQLMDQLFNNRYRQDAAADATETEATDVTEETETVEAPAEAVAE